MSLTRGVPSSGCGQHSGVSTGLLSGTGGTDAIITVSVQHDIVAPRGHTCWRKLSQQAQQTPRKQSFSLEQKGGHQGLGVVGDIVALTSAPGGSHRRGTEGSREVTWTGVLRGAAESGLMILHPRKPWVARDALADTELRMNAP